MGRKYASIFVRADAMNGEALRSAWERANPLKPLAMPDPVSIMENSALAVTWTRNRPVCCGR